MDRRRFGKINPEEKKPRNSEKGCEIRRDRDNYLVREVWKSILAGLGYQYLSMLPDFGWVIVLRTVKPSTA